MLEGTVKWFNEEKGYGFIEPRKKDLDDVFVHVTALHDSGYQRIEKGEPVEFSLVEDRFGRSRAEDIVVYEYV